MLIEDDVDLRTVEELALSAAGYEVIAAPEGGVALDWLTHDRSDVILLDMRMPGVNGWQFMARFRATYGHEIPIVVVTAAEDAERVAADVDAEDWLAKPFEVDDLLDVVARHVRPTTVPRV